MFNPFNWLPSPIPFIGRKRGPAQPENILKGLETTLKYTKEEKVFKRFKFSDHEDFQANAVVFLQDEWGINPERKERVNFIQFKGGILAKHIPFHDGLLFNRKGTEEWFRFDLFKDEDGTLYCECVKCLDWSSLDGPGDDNSTSKLFYSAETSLNEILRSTAKAMRVFGEFNIVSNNCISFVNNILEDLNVSEETAKNVSEFIKTLLSN